MKDYIPSYAACSLCPRSCNVDRTAHKYAFCGETADLKISSACLHFGEEPPITVVGGSGTIFISGCNLGCIFCQNHQISHEGMGSVVSTNDFVRMCLCLQDAGAENINIITGSHAIPAIAKGLNLAKKTGLTIPICWNSSAFESLDAIAMLEGLVDIWLPDLKTLNSAVSSKLFYTQDYATAATKAILRMIEVSPLKFKTLSTQLKSSAPEKMLSGVIIRHLILPDLLDDSEQVLDWLKLNADGKACVSLMSQYTPVYSKKLSEQGKNAIPNRFVSEEEFKHMRTLVDEYAFEHLFYQELIQADEWLPDFNRIQPFSHELAKPLWHWRDGFID